MLINFQNNLPRDGVDFLSYEISISGSICYYYFFFTTCMCLPAHPWDIKTRRNYQLQTSVLRHARD